MPERVARELRAGVAAISFLTRVPVGRAIELDGDDVRRAGPAFPLVGAGIGAVVGSVAFLLAKALPAGAAAGVALVVYALLTGALHLDGLADCADALGGRTRERALEIMRDHAIGAYGGTALVLDLLLKATALAALAGTAHVIAVAAAAGAASRVAPVLLAWRLPYARAGGGTGASLTGGSAARAAVAAAVAIALALVVARRDGAVLLAVATGVCVAAGFAARRRFGGVTGDVLGATAELVELAGLLTAAALVS